MPRTRDRLLGCLVRACMASRMWLLQHVPHSLALPAALVAGTPVAPVTPLAVDLVPRWWASCRCTRLCLSKGAVAAMSSIFRLVLHSPLACPLTTPASCRAIAPVLPESEHAISRLSCSRAALRYHATSARIARGCLLQIAFAESATPTAVHSNATCPPLNTEARVGASTPNIPMTKHTIYACDACHVVVAARHFLREAQRRLPAVRCRSLHRPGPPRGTASTSLRAGLPGCPLAPDGVDAGRFSAVESVAGSQLLLVLSRTGQSTLPWWRFNVTSSALLATTTGAAAYCPSGPTAPLTVFVPAIRVQAALRLRK
mmetsp:Transcript_71248/g.130428  ORF Transcript_71248/g.130428 Transcript_71248/m.130428 type:complete len:315 (+) Transcript_71248:537-1481(+)